MPLVSGVVASPAGSPLAGVHVLAWCPDEPRRRAETRTDITGTWRLELPAGSWVVRPFGQPQQLVDVAADPVDTAGSDGVGTGLSQVPGREALAAALARRREGSS